MTDQQLITLGSLVLFLYVSRYRALPQHLLLGYLFVAVSLVSLLDWAVATLFMIVGLLYHAIARPLE